jgi:glutamyl-tRNA synthetase
MEERLTPQASGYRGRLAPSPTGLLHLGHAQTFWTAYERCAARGGTLVLRNEDLDPARSKPEFAAAMIEDLTWLGIQWKEGPDCGGPFGPYSQSQRRELYAGVFEQLLESGRLYPCVCSRQDIARALQAPHAADDEPVYPGTCRAGISTAAAEKSSRLNWRFRVPDGEVIRFSDALAGGQEFVAGRDFGDFIVWRADGAPSYQLAVVADDAAMRITEVVRGADLLVSTARQILLYRALGLRIPTFCHCPLVTDASGTRLAKRHDALSLRAMRERGTNPASIIENFRCAKRL